MSQECNIEELNKLLGDWDSDAEEGECIGTDEVPSCNSATYKTNKLTSNLCDAKPTHQSLHTWSDNDLKDELKSVSERQKLIADEIQRRREENVDEDRLVINTSADSQTKSNIQENDEMLSDFSQNFVNMKKHNVVTSSQTTISECTTFADALVGGGKRVSNEKALPCSERLEESVVHTGESSDEEFMDEYGLTVRGGPTVIGSGCSRGVIGSHNVDQYQTTHGAQGPVLQSEPNEPSNTTKRIAHQALDKHGQDVIEKRKLLKEKLSKERAEAAKQDNMPFYKEPITELVIKNPVVSHKELAERMKGRKICKLSVLDYCMFNGKISGDWITLGAIVEKTETKQSVKGNKYMIWKLNDLRDETKTVSFFLFKEVYEQYWKLNYGMVIGLLNATLMEQNKSKSSGGSRSASEVALTVSHPGQIMVIGESRDLVRCQSLCKGTGERCKNFANRQTGAACVYHLTSRLRALSGRRGELNTTLSSVKPKAFDVKYRETSKSAEFKHQGQFFTSAPLNQLTDDERQNKSHARKDIKLPANLNEQMKTFHNKMTKINAENKAVAMKRERGGVVMKASEVLAGTARAPAPPQPPPPAPAAARDRVPQLGRGLAPAAAAGPRSVTLGDGGPPTRSPAAAANMARAISVVKRSGSGGVARRDPNSVRSVCAGPVSVPPAPSPDMAGPPPGKRSRLGELNMTPEQIDALINATSKHDEQYQQAEHERLGEHLNMLGKKDEVEERLANLTELPCKVVICKQCKYRAFSQGEACRKLGHKVSKRDGKKRFFKCAECKQRAVSCDRYPDQSCRKCGSTKYERTSVLKEKSGICQERDVLLTRGEEKTFINSVPNQIALL